MPGDPVDIIDDERAQQFVAHVDGHDAQLVYRREPDRLVLVHTEVPDELGGRGLGGRLVAAAVEDARARGVPIQPDCPFARQWIERHPDRVDGMEVL